MYARSLHLRFPVQALFAYTERFHVYKYCVVRCTKAGGHRNYISLAEIHVSIVLRKEAARSRPSYTRIADGCL
jgi:hypothetical protein